MLFIADSVLVFRRAQLQQRHRSTPLPHQVLPQPSSPRPLPQPCSADERSSEDAEPRVPFPRSTVTIQGSRNEKASSTLTSTSCPAGRYGRARSQSRGVLSLPPAALCGCRARWALPAVRARLGERSRGWHGAAGLCQQHAEPSEALLSAPSRASHSQKQEPQGRFLCRCPRAAMSVPCSLLVSWQLGFFHSPPPLQSKR